MVFVHNAIENEITLICNRKGNKEGGHEFNEYKYSSG